MYFVLKFRLYIYNVSRTRSVFYTQYCALTVNGINLYYYVPHKIPAK